MFQSNNTKLMFIGYYLGVVPRYDQRGGSMRIPLPVPDDHSEGERYEQGGEREDYS